MTDSISVKIPQISLDYLSEIGFDNINIMKIYSFAINELIEYSSNQVKNCPHVKKTSCLLSIYDYIFMLKNYGEYISEINKPFYIDDDLINHCRIIFNNLENDLWLNHYIIYGNTSFAVKDIIDNYLIINF